MVRVKICGITRLEDALYAEESGADALGFIFYKKSKRYTEPSAVASITSKLNPFISKVGVFVNEELEVINRIISECGLTHVQLHGEETIDIADKINGQVIKALNFDDQLSERINMWAKYPLLVDSGSRELQGGTGITLPWDKLKSLINSRPIILAGGLNPENVTNGIKIVNPIGVDVSSGVEKSPGIKNKDLISKFMKIIKTIDQEN